MQSVQKVCKFAILQLTETDSKYEISVNLIYNGASINKSRNNSSL